MEVDAATSSSAKMPPEIAPGDDGGRLPRRSPNDRYLGGVAGGIADHFDIDPFIIRAAILGSTLFAAYAADWIPIIPAGYTLLWLLLPASAGRSVLHDFRSRPGRREMVAALASFVVIAVMLTRPVFGFALALAALAWVLLSDDPPVDGAVSSEQPHASYVADGGPDPSTSDASARASWGRRRRSERGETLVTNFARAPRRPRREPALWPLTLSLIAIVAIGGFMADAVLDPGVDPGLLVNIALIAVGAVIMISAWRGRALWTVLLAIALLPAWIGFSVADVGRFADSGTTTHTPTVLPGSGTLTYENGYGAMTIDLRQLPLADGDELTLHIKATAGTVTVLAPPTAATVLQSKVGLGTTTVRGNGLSYFEYDREPHMDRTMVRRYEARGSGCIQDYWAAWWLVVANHARAGVAVSHLDVTDPEAVSPIVEAIAAAGFAEPELIDDGSQSGFDYEDSSQPYAIFDEFGNEFVVVGGSAYPVNDDSGAATPVVPLVPQANSNVRDRTWSYSADSDGLPCVETAAATNAATIKINATIGIGTLEVHRDEF